ncbi:SDR family oxidoreductase [Sphingomonas sp. RRHST34]|uniref:SDR family oxidoreductase n=1 Tax=Sphingomonas citri TaxID=2862499 RepID=A0ABS7BIE2_9SPHN|nr:MULTISPECIES: SDR family oxidoreductase [Sphingomonas]MBW6529315.1 SDR family oxidoreductase [Sphingomonas citri]TCP29187.1 uncharacterized protein YbjT (DUF2867 family) [Sphingomonas sp. BK235]
MILVLGATGGIGGEVCRQLKQAGAPFRAMARKQEQIDRLRQDGVDAALGDLDRPETLTAAMTGIDTLFLVTAPEPPQVARETAAIDAARRAGVGRIVKISASDCNVRSKIPWARAHALIDHHLRASGVDWTILMPTAFMQNFLWFTKPVAKGYLPLGAGKGSVSWIDSRDIARVAATVLTQDGHSRATYFLTGPQTFDMKDAAAQLSKVTERNVRYLDLPVPVFRTVLRLAGNSRWMANGLIAQFSDMVAGHHDIDPTGEVERLTGEPPKDFASFLRDHRDAFARAA